MPEIENMNQLRKYLNLSHMMILVTLDEDGNPYTSNVYFAYDEKACYFISRTTREHSQHILKNNSIAWSIINTEEYVANAKDKKGLQFQGKCILLGVEEGGKIFEEIYNPRIGFKNGFPDGHRVYKCIPKKVKIWDEELYGGEGKIIEFNEKNMKIIDLSMEIYTGMPVFPGDPEVEITQECTIENDEWNMKRIHINSHDGTHVNIPIHAKIGGKTLDDYTLENFVGPARLYEKEDDITSQEGLIFHETDITMEIAEKIIAANTPFIGLPSKFEFDLEIEKYLLEHDIISFERLENTEKLPKKFFFHGAPLKIRNGDGSPVRAYAVID